MKKIKSQSYLVAGPEPHRGNSLNHRHRLDQFLVAGRPHDMVNDGASIQCPEISEGYVPMADAYSSKKNPIRAVSKNKDRRVSEQDAARSRSNQRGRAPSQSTKRRI